MKRKHILFVAVLIVASFCMTLAQAPSRRSRGPRAMAVVEVTPAGRARLIPVTIWIDGKLYDATLYRATPRPMALDAETLYDVLRSGNVTGTFTVRNYAQGDGVWVSDGRIKPVAKDDTPSEVHVGKRSSRPASDDEDKPPVLRRPGTGDDAAAKKAPNASPPETQSKPRQEAPATAAAREPDDPDRPVLRRGVPEPKPEAPESKPAVNKGAAPAQQSPKVERYTAISDANSTDYRPYDVTLAPEDRERFLREMTGMAMEAVTRFATTRPTSGTPAPGPMQDGVLRAFDLDLNNTPLVIYSARKQGIARNAKQITTADPRLDFYVTIVARTDMYGNIRRLFSHVTDAPHMDAIPRLEFIDAVDAEGTGRGQLLFRQIFDTGQNFILYRAGADKLWELFEGAGKR